MLAIAVIGVESVLAVPGFAQSNGVRFSIAADRTSTSAMREYVARADTTDAWNARLPANLLPASVYRDLIETMLRRSPTFRRQCQRIGNARELTVTLQSRQTPAARVRARTQLIRRDARLIAAIDIIGMDNPVELIAHEIEHIIEQLDGVDLASRAVVAASGVEISAADERSFETTRAIRAGLTVAAEVRRGGA